MFIGVSGSVFVSCCYRIGPAGVDELRRALVSGMVFNRVACMSE